MGSLKNIRTKIRSVKETQKITRSMELISSTKLKKIEKLAKEKNQQIEALSYILYSKAVSSSFREIKKYFTLQNIIPNDQKKFYLTQNVEREYLLVVFTSEKGLCGGFNNTLLNHLLQDIASLSRGCVEHTKFKIILIGKKGYDTFLEMDLLKDLYKYFSLDNTTESEIVQSISDEIISLISSNRFEGVFVYYFQFQNTLNQFFDKKQMFPVSLNEEECKIFGDPKSLEFEGKNLLKFLLRLYVKIVIKYVFLQNSASEHAARRTVMENATNNAGDIIDNLYLKLHKKRQAIITTELIEIISGLEALSQD